MIKFLIETFVRLLDAMPGSTENASISFSTSVSMPSLTLHGTLRGG